MESTLTCQFVDLCAEVGLFLGYGRGNRAPYTDPAWTVQQQAAIDSCVKSGLRQFYFPPPLEGEAGSYDWSFLKPVASLDFALGASVIPLPDDFGGFEGQISVLSQVTQVTWPIDLISEARIRQMYSVTPTTTGRPLYAGVQPLKGTTGTQGQRFQLLVYPLADQEYVFQVPYYVNPDYLSGAFPYAYGGSPHTETILESCLCMAEQRFDDAAGVHSMKFRERLAASISMDRRLKPQMLGYNRDGSDGHSWPNRQDLHYLSLVTVKGTQY